jgi:hypothetical protein
MPKPTLFIIGADKGGVGKTKTTRVFLDYLSANGIDFNAYDTQQPEGALVKFFPDKTQVVNLRKSDDQVKVFDNLTPARVGVMDIEAGLLSKTLDDMKVIGLLDAAKQGQYVVNVLHVLGPSSQSLDEVDAVAKALNGSRYIPIANHINDTEYVAPEGAIHIPKLDELASKAVDAAKLPFSAFTTSGASFTLRGYVRSWMGLCFEQFNLKQLNVLT